MKNKKILIISLCAVLIALVAAASVMLKRNSISKHSLIYADVNDKLISYKISEKAKTRIFLTDIRNICLSASISVGNIAAFPRAKIHFMMCC